MRLQDLNSEQRKAATTLEGPVLVTAGAGSGKTRMLVSRFGQALDADPPIPMSEVVAITFTEKAAGELAERVRQDMRDRGSDALGEVDAAWISTIHGLCARLLRENALEIGLDPAFRVLDNVAARAVLDQAMEQSVAGVLEMSAQARDLFSAFSYREVSVAVETLSRALRSRGADCDRCVLVPAPRLERVIAQGRAALEAADAEFAAADADSAVVSAWRGEIAKVDALLLSLSDMQREVGHEEIALVLRTLSRPFPKHSKARVSAIFKGLKEAHESICSQLAAVWAAPLAEAMVDITRRTMRAAEALRAQAGTLDFDDLQVKTVELLRANPDVAARYRAQFKLFMIDEFQDTDALQLEIVESLAGSDLCTVGDARQSIYRFRGADLSVYEAHVAEMRAAGATEAELSENYRSHEHVIAFVNEFFSSHNLFGPELHHLDARRRESEAWWLSKELGSDPRVEAIIVSKEGTSEEPSRRVAASAVARRLRMLHDAGVSSNEMVVLLRSFGHAADYAEALDRVGLRAVMLGGSRFYDLPETAILEALVRVLANPRDDEALGIVLASELGDVPDGVILRLRGAERTRLWTALRRCDELLSGEALRRAHQVAAAIQSGLNRLGDARLSAVLLETIEALDYDLVLLGKGQSGAESYANVLKFLRLADQFEAGGGVGALGFARHVRLQRELREPEAPATVVDEHTDAVRLMTIHGAKGLEFPVVAVPELGAPLSRSSASRARVGLDSEAGIEVALCPPNERASGRGVRPEAFERLDRCIKEADAEEAKRLLYVAFTRAREVLILSGVSSPKEISGLTASGTRWLRETLGLPEALDPIDEVRTVGSGKSQAPVRVRVLEGVPDGTDERPTPSVPVTRGHTECRVRPPAARELPGPRRLSFSHIAAYRSCPRRFYAEYVMGLKSQQDSGPDRARTFGSALHSAMESADAAGGVSAERLRAVALQHGLTSEGVERLGRAVRNVASFDSVRRALGDSSRGREVPFALDIHGSDAEGDGEGFTLYGFIDVYRREGDCAYIVDYKSGSSPHASSESAADRYRLQAECYALAALEVGAARVCVSFVFPEVEPCDEPRCVEYAFDGSDAARIKSDLLATALAIQAGVWDGRDAHDAIICSECPLVNALCDVRRAPS